MRDLQKHFLSSALAVFQDLVDNNECSKQDIAYWSGISKYELERRGVSIGKKCWLTKDEASELLEVSRATFDRIVQSGGIPRGRKVKGKKNLLWNCEDVEEYKRMSLLMSRR